MNNALPMIMRNCTVRIEQPVGPAESKMGQVEELKLPVVELQTEEYRGGGMDGSVDLDLGMKKIDVNFKLFSFDRQAHLIFGLAPGNFNLTKLTFFGHLVSEMSGTPSQAMARMLAMPLKVDPGTWTPGKKSQLDVTLNVRSYQLTVGRELLYDIDFMIARRIIGGIDQLAAMRQNLQL